MRQEVDAIMGKSGHLELATPVELPSTRRARSGLRVAPRPGLRWRVVAPQWPLWVGSHEVVPVELPGGWAGTVHLAENPRVSDPATAPWGHGPGASSRRPMAPGPALSTFCGRPYVAVVTEPGLDLLGEDVDRLCGSCWRSVERWLSPPPAADGEDEVVRWIMSVVLETGEAMVEGVPVPRLESIRRRARSELKAAIGGSVQTRVFGRSALWVHSGLVTDSKTPERWQREMRAAADRMSAIEAGQPVDPPRWRRRWDEITGSQ